MSIVIAPRGDRRSEVKSSACTARSSRALCWLPIFSALAAVLLNGCSTGDSLAPKAAVATAAISIDTATLPTGQVGIAYTASLAASGGTAPYSWSLASGTLPAGLTLSASQGLIRGMPTATAFNSTLMFKVQDSSSPAQSNSAQLTLTIAPAALAITTTSLPNGQVGAAYSASLAATGGTAPYRWSITSGSLPSGLALNAATGAISGTATATATHSALTFEVADSSTPALSKSISLSLTIAAAISGKLAVTTISLPDAQLAAHYTTTLAASGGTAPYTWTLSAGTLPSGLSLNGGTGAISGTPTATVVATPLTFQVTDSSDPVQKAAASLTLTVGAAVSVTVSVSPRRIAAAVTQAVTLAATTNDAAGVTWSISPSGGAFNHTSSLSGVSVTLTAPASAGVYTVTASSVTQPSASSSTTIAITDLAGVYSYHNDLARDGANTQEYALTTSSVSTSTFGKLFSCTVDGAIYAQPLWVASLAVGGSKHNVIFVATQHDTMFAFDADASPCVQLWTASLIDAGHGGTSGETPVPSEIPGSLVGEGDGDIEPEIGITGTPVIDPASGTLYAVTKSANTTSGTLLYQRLHAIDLTTGNEKPGSPITITATFPGSGDGGSSVSFNARTANQRSGLALIGGSVYIGWASHESAPPFYGWLIRYTYNGSSFTQAAVFNVTPNAGRGGIWMGGSAPAADSSNNIYLITGDGAFDASSASAPNNDYGDSLLKLTAGLGVSQYFTPTDQASDSANDIDFGAGGATVLADLPAGSPVTHLVMGGGKDGTLYVLNRDALGGSGDSHAWQKINVNFAIFSTPVFWNNYFYLAGSGGAVVAYQLNASSAQFSEVGSTSLTFGYPGSQSSLSAAGTSNGILWTLDGHQYCTNQSPACGPAVLHAYEASSLSTELWNSALVSADAAGFAVKFNLATIANGKVYVGTRGNNTGGLDSTSSRPGELDVYGLKPN